MSQDALDDPLERLEQLVPLCDSIRKGAEYGAALAQANSEVRKASALPMRLESLEPTLRQLRDQQLPVNDLTLDLDKMSIAGRTLELCVNTDALKDARFPVQAALEALQRIENVLTKAWVARVSAEFGPLQSLGSVLAGIPDIKGAGLELQQWARQTIQSAGGAPTVDAMASLAAAQAELPARLSALGLLGIDAEVRAFLLEVAASKATVGNMTPRVLDWLRTQRVQSRFRIQFT